MLPVAFLLAVFAIVQLFLPLASALRIGPDEDYEMAKATLCLKGHRLYTEVWNDQPPLHTFIAVELLKQFSGSMLGPRLITVTAAALMLVSLFSIARRFNGAWAALIAPGLLIASPGFLELSSSCMVEIPAVAPAVL